MRSLRFKLYVCCVLCLFFDNAWAYERETHEFLSEYSFATSNVAGDLVYFATMGIDLEQTYPSNIDIYENTDLKDKPQKLVKRGGFLEDGAKCSTAVVNHFYDPIYDAPYNGGEKSPDWAIDSINNTYSLAQARNYLYTALTHHDEELRNLHKGRVFQTLGQVAHHITDMAQPAHSRNDAHLSVEECPTFFEWIVNESPSLFEKYLGRFKRDEIVERITKGKRYGSVMLAKARNYWVNEDEGSNRGTGFGMAEYSNNNFVSRGTNFLYRGRALPYIKYPLPVPLNGGINEDIEVLEPDPNKRCHEVNGVQSCLKGEIEFYRSIVVDKYDSVASENEKASALSLFDIDLLKYNKEVEFLIPNSETGSIDKVRTQKVFTVNSKTVDSALNFLLPRAAAFGSGLIDYFFRGRMDAKQIELTDNGITLKVANTIDADKYPGWKDEDLNPDGQLVLAYQYKLGDVSQYASVAATQTELGESVVPGAQSSAQYDFDYAIPPGAMDIEERIIYRGRLGEEEDGIAVGTVEPPGFILQGKKLVTKRSGTWTLSPLDGLESKGNIDWRGARAERIFYSGPASRYFIGLEDTTVYERIGWVPYNWLGFEMIFRDEAYRCSSINEYGACIWVPVFDEQVYQNGRLLVVAPAPVFGAALRERIRNGKSEQWISVITWDANPAGDHTLIKVYTRPINSTFQNIGIFDDIAYQAAVQALEELQNSATASPYQKEQAELVVTREDSKWRLIGEFQLPVVENDPITFDSIRRFTLATPWFFNEFGTEAQAMVIFEDGLRRLKIKIDRTSEVTSLEDLGNLSGETEAPRISSRRRIVSDDPNTFVACDEELETESFVQTTQTNTQSGLQYQRSHVAAVDYVGSDEVLLQINVSRSESQDTLQSTKFDYSRSCYLSATVNNTLTRNSERNIESNYTYVVIGPSKLGKFISGARSEFIRDYADISYSSPSMYSGGGGYEETFNSESSRLIYLDLRHDIALIETNETERFDSGVWVNQQPPGEAIPLTTSGDYRHVVRRKFELNHAGEIRLLESGVPVSVDKQSSRTISWPPFCKHPSCLSEEGADDRTDIGQVEIPAGGTPSILGGLRGSLAVDNMSNVAYSFKYWKWNNHTDFATTLSKYRFNGITGADLPVLMGDYNQDAVFYPVGLLQK